MIQLQYYNKGLTKTQIEHILNNYRLKYTTLTNEINLKLNSFVKTVLNDISPFLENIEEISKEMKNLKEMDNHKIKIEILEQKLKEKAIMERQLQSDVDSLRKELISLKEKNESRNSSNNLLKDKEIKTTPLSPKVTREKKNIVFDLNIENAHSSRESKELSPKKNNNNKNQEDSSKSTILNIQSNSSITKRENQKNKKKNNYMMNMQEITRNINNYHNEVQANRTNKNINKFISPSNRKIVQKEIKNKKKRIDKSKSIDLSNAMDTESNNQKMEINNIANKINKENNSKQNKANNDNNTNNSNNTNNTNNTNNDNNDKLNKELEKEYFLIDEKLEEEIKELEIDEENILKIIEDIKIFENNNKGMV